MLSLDDVRPSTILITLSFFGLIYMEKVYRYIFHSPGYGMIQQQRDKKTKRNELFVESDICRVKIPTYYNPDAQQLDIFLFRSSVIPENKLIDSK